MSTKEGDLSPSQRARLRELLDEVGNAGEAAEPSEFSEPGSEPASEAGSGSVDMTADLPSDPAIDTSSEPSQPASMDGLQIGPYRVKRLIGGGGMGQVYEAVQEHPRRTVALKVMRASIDSESARRRFEFEAQILARLQHPNIAQIYEAGMWIDEGRERPYFVMEYVAGRPIDAFVCERALSLNDRLRLFAQICDAVGHGHERGIIHRDLKPGNVLVDGDGRVKVIDFGVARATDSDMRITQAQTSVGQIVGTIQYMSPEQCAADPNDIDIRSDVYALGVMLYQLLVDRLPYDLSKTAIHEAVRVVQEVEPTGITSIDASIPRDIDTIIGKALQKERGRRYRSAGELGDDVRRFLADEAIVARPPSLSEHIRRYARKHRATTTAVVTVAIASILAVGAILFFGIEAQRQRGIAQQEAQTAREQRALAEEATAATEAALVRETLARSQAERNAQLVSDAALSLFGPVTTTMKDLPAATEAREVLVTNGLELLEELRSAGGENPDPVVLGKLAFGYEALGDLFGGRRTADLGRPEDALEQYAQAEAIWRGLRMKDPDSVEAASQLALVINKHADLLYEADPDAALALLEESRRINMQLFTRFPNQGSLIKNYYATLERIADALLEKEQLAQALVLCIEFRDLASMLHEAYPEHAQAARDLGMALRRVGYIRGEQAEYREAETAFRRSFDLMVQVQELEPNNVRRWSDVGWASWFLGTFLLEHGDREEGATLLIRCADHMVQACTLAPNVADYRFYVRQAVPEVCATLHAAQMTDRAVALRRDVLLRLQPVVEANPENLALAEVFETIRIHEVAGVHQPD